MNAKCAVYLLKKLQKLQNRAARVITGSSYETSSEDILSELDWQPLKERFRIKKATFETIPNCHNQWLTNSKRKKIQIVIYATIILGLLVFLNK